MAEIPQVVDGVLEARFHNAEDRPRHVRLRPSRQRDGEFVKDQFNMTPGRWEHDRMVELARRNWWKRKLGPESMSRRICTRSSIHAIRLCASRERSSRCT